MITDVGSNGKPICDFLLVINTITDIPSCTVSKLSQIIVEILDTLRF